MGAAVRPGLGIAPGTVIATFNRKTGKYENRSSGNHTAIFLRWGSQNGWLGTYHYAVVLEQGPGFGARRVRKYYSRFTPISITLRISGILMS